MAGANIPGRDGDEEADGGDDRDEWSVVGEVGAAKEANAGIERGEAEGDDPAEHELDETAVNGEWIAAEGDEIPERRMDSDAVFEPEGDGAEEQKEGNVNGASANGPEDQGEDAEKAPVNAEMM